MKLVELAIRRPVTITMLMAGILFFGFLSWRQLPQDLFPAISLPQLTVVTRYANAAPEEMEELVTRPIEEAVTTTRNLKNLRSVSREGMSLVTAQFNWGTSPDFAALEIREKLDLIREELPRDCDEPVVKKFNPFATPLLLLSLSGADEKAAELLSHAENHIKEALQRVPGVASVTLSGGEKKEFFVEVDPARLDRRGLDLMQIVRAVKESNVNYPAGSTKEAVYEMVVRTLGEIKSAEDLENVVVQTPAGKKEELSSLVHLKDVARVRAGYKERESLSRLNGRKTIGLAVYPQTSANAVTTARGVREAVEKIRAGLPRGMKLDVVYDKAQFIEDSIGGVRSAGLQGGFLAFLVLLVFLAQPRTAAIVAFSIPVSIAATLTLMLLAGISVNMISLGGLALGIGMLLDNAIVIVENTARRRALGDTWGQAALRGAKEVAAPVTASTLTSIAVFLPMIFLGGLEAELFRDLALTVIFVQLTSLMVALVLLPRWAAHQRNEFALRLPRVETWTAARFERLKQFYGRLLGGAIAHPQKTARWAAAAIGAALLVFLILPKELLPRVDRGEFLVSLTMPMGSRLEATARAAQKVEKILMRDPAVKRVALTVGSESDADGESLRALGSHEALFAVICRERRRAATAQVMRRLERAVAQADLELGRVRFAPQDSLLATQQDEGKGIRVEVRGQDLAAMRAAVGQVKKRIGAIAQAAQIEDSIPLPSPEIRIEIDKARGALYQLSSKEIAMAAQAAIKGVVATQLREEGREVDVRVRLDPASRGDLSTLKGIAVVAGDGVEAPLEEVAALKQATGPSQIERLNNSRVFYVTCDAAKGSRSRLEEKIARGLAAETFPPSVQVELAGDAAERRESLRNLTGALILSVILIYMILAAQFESFREPFLILFTVPFSLVGVAGALFLTWTPVSVMALLGMILLGGIVVNNGILLIEYIHQARDEGKSLEEAVVEAGKTRLRPILMTMLTSVLGLFPFLIGGGPESQLQGPMALTLAGGLAISTLLTLVLLPLLCLRFMKNSRLIRDKAPAGMIALAVLLIPALAAAPPARATTIKEELTLKLPPPPKLMPAMEPATQSPTPTPPAPAAKPVRFTMTLSPADKEEATLHQELKQWSKSLFDASQAKFKPPNWTYRGEPLTLKNCFEKAQLAHGPLTIAKEEYYLARLRHREALRNLLPAANIEAEGIEGSTVGEDFRGRGVEINVQQPIWDGFKRWKLLMQAKLNMEIARVNYEKIYLELEAEVRKSHALLASSQKNREARRALVDEAEKVLESARLRLRQNLLREVDFMTVQNQFDEMAFQLKAAERDWMLAQLALKQLLRYYRDEPIRLAPDEAPPRAGVTMEECLKLAHDRRPDLRLAKLNADILRYGRDIAKNDTGFQVNADGSFGYRAENFDSEDLDYEDEYFVGLSASLPLWHHTLESNTITQDKVPSAGQTTSTDFRSQTLRLNLFNNFGKSKRWEAAIRYHRALDELDKTERNLLFQVGQSYFEYRKTLDGVLNAAEKRKLEQKEAEHAAHQVGLNEAPLSDLLAAWGQKTSSEVEYWNAFAASQIALSELNKAVGGRGIYSAPLAQVDFEELKKKPGKKEYESLHSVTFE